MRVVHLISSLKVGGAESFLVDLLKNLKDSDIENYVIYFHPGPNIEKIEKMGIKCIGINKAFFLYDPLFIFDLFRKIKKIDPDLIHSHLWAANFFSYLSYKLFNIPNVVTLHNLLSVNSCAPLYKAVLRKYLNSIILRSKKIIAVSNNIKKDIIFNYKNFNGSIDVILNGINVDEFIPAKKDNKKFVIGSVGRFVKIKKHEFLINAFYKLSLIHEDLELVLIGQGELESYLKSLVSSFKIESKVKFIKTDNAKALYSSFDCFILPSDQEGLSIALLEALAFQIPVLVASKSKNHEVINNMENGLVFESEEELISGLELLFNNPDLRSKLAQEGRDFVENRHNLAQISSEYFKIYKSL